MESSARLHLRRRVARVGLAHQPLQRPVQDNFKQWAERARCTDAPKKDAPRGNTTCERYTQCDPSVPEVTLCTVQGLAHDWPGEKDGLAATPALLDFFGRVRRPR